MHTFRLRPKVHCSSPARVHTKLAEKRVDDDQEQDRSEDGPLWNASTYRVAIADVAVIGVPDEAAGELPKAFVALAPGASLDLDEVQAFVGEHFVSYKQIRLLEIIDVIPKSASGKILRRELRDRDN